MPLRSYPPFGSLSLRLSVSVSPYLCLSPSLRLSVSLYLSLSLSVSVSLSRCLSLFLSVSPSVSSSVSLSLPLTLCLPLSLSLSLCPSLSLRSAPPSGPGPPQPFLSRGVMSLFLPALELLSPRSSPPADLSAPHARVVWVGREDALVATSFHFVFHTWFIFSFSLGAFTTTEKLPELSLVPPKCVGSGWLPGYPLPPFRISPRDGDICVVQLCGRPQAPLSAGCEASPRATAKLFP